MACCSIDYVDSAGGVVQGVDCNGLLQYRLDSTGGVVHGVDCSGMLQYRQCRLGWRGGAGCRLQWPAAVKTRLGWSGGAWCGLQWPAAV